MTAHSTARSARNAILSSFALALLLTGFTIVPTEAAIPGDRLAGHRCRTYSSSVTKENTVDALRETAGVPGAWCEIDLKKLSDGTLIVWHDPTWSRVADPATLPTGVVATDNVSRATWDQVSQIRTRGGAPVATFKDMILASAKDHVPLLVEVVNGVVPRPADWVDYAEKADADVRYYQPVSSMCTTTQLDALKASRAVIGIKTVASPPCALSAQQMQDKGATFVVNDASAITSAYVADMNAHGLTVYARGATKESAQALFDKGVARLMVERPAEATLWGSPPQMQPLTGDRLLGHRCRTYDQAVTHENTVTALIAISGVTGAWCEIDVWRLSDGTMIVWDDATWSRAADPATLPDGVAATDRVASAKWTQVSQIKTRGGSSVTTFTEMIDASVVHKVPLVVEIRNAISDPAVWVDYAASAAASVRYFQVPTGSTCAAVALGQLRAAKAITGIKMPNSTSACKLTPQGVQDRGATFVLNTASEVTASYTADMTARGVDVYATGVTRTNARGLLGNGAKRLLVERPGDAVAW
jgi:glycerophosphoryl diester phosphodiesterase